MDKYRCKVCNYVVEAIQQKMLCPNCGEKNTLEMEQSADELLDSF